MTMNSKKLMPVFENGMAQPVFPFTDGKTGVAYDAKTSDIVRFCVYVEANFDTNGDGKGDLIKAFVQVPRSAAEGNYKAASVFEARPYCAGVNADGYDHMKEVEGNACPGPDSMKINYSPEPGNPSKYISTMEAAEKADPADWHFPDHGNGDAMCYENIDAYNYYLVRGFAVVLSAGVGTLGSDGFEYTGSDCERDSFRCIVEWLHGDRIAYADRNREEAIRADWSNGKVAMTGRSYAGTMPFAVATTGVAGLETIVPVAGISDWYSFLNQQGAQRYWPAEMLMSFLAYFCSSRYNDPALTEEQRQAILDFHQYFSYEQMKTGFDYSDFWKEGNYTLKADGIRCSALIIHGLNDENVSTKQFEMMLHSFEEADRTVKVILHQGPHITPTMANKGYGISINGRNYDDIVNKWISHYLYDVENDAEDMPAVLVQNNVDQDQWDEVDSWETECDYEFCSSLTGTTVIDTDWEKAGINKENFDERMSLLDSNMNQRYFSDKAADDLTIQGSVCVKFDAALKDGDASKNFEPENINDADRLSFELGSASGKMDDVKLTVLLCDVADEEFPSIQTVDPERNVIPVVVRNKGGIHNGGDLPDFDQSVFETVNRKYCVITRAYIDLCNPESGYAPETSENSIELVLGEKHSYNVYLNPARYTVEAGHRLAAVIGTEDPVNCLIHKKYSVEIDNASVKADIPMV